MIQAHGVTVLHGDDWTPFVMGAVLFIGIALAARLWKAMRRTER